MRINNRAAIKTCKEVRNIVSTFRLISCSFDSTNERTIYRYIIRSILRFDINQKKKRTLYLSIIVLEMIQPGENEIYIK